MFSIDKIAIIDRLLKCSFRVGKYGSSVVSVWDTQGDFSKVEEITMI